MLIMMFVFILVAIIANLMMILCMILSKKSLYEREKFSPFECGFDQKSSSRMPFSLRFFLITIIFLIFDVEIALILPAINQINLSTANQWLLMNTLFLIILLIGLFHEWNQGALEWSN
uniref:NADH-ubiquinone oxidoreductase chain 3 n=1 Tax=Psococerastis albimaculata TaxID=1264641 RepID=M9P406_9NEOP|nr:NADH dehydrogenase subunit 3 [Psococerastis albimaculata]AFY16891.1 NADH dehydrogenase subunit 3 [Psococerastis albimaculata]